jgi:hypothetical protein
MVDQSSQVRRFIVVLRTVCVLSAPNDAPPRREMPKVDGGSLRRRHTEDEPATDGRNVAWATIEPMTTNHRVHVVPWLRRLGGRVLISDWLAITVGRDIVAWRPLDEVELAHELAHVRQWERDGAAFAARYALASLVALAGGRHWYRDNVFEVAARSAATARGAEIAAEEAVAVRRMPPAGRRPAGPIDEAGAPS